MPRGAFGVSLPCDPHHFPADQQQSRLQISLYSLLSKQLAAYYHQQPPCLLAFCFRSSCFSGMRHHAGRSCSRTLSALYFGLLATCTLPESFAAEPAASVVPPAQPVEEKLTLDDLVVTFGTNAQDEHIGLARATRAWRKVPKNVEPWPACFQSPTTKVVWPARSGTELDKGPRP